MKVREESEKPDFKLNMGFPDSSVGKEFSSNEGDPDSITGWGGFAGEGIGYPLQYSWASLVPQLAKNLPAILIPACDSSSLSFLMMYSAPKLNKQGDNIQP